MHDTFFPIAFWCGLPENVASLARYREIADAGFTVAQITGETEVIRKPRKVREETWRE